MPRYLFRTTTLEPTGIVREIWFTAELPDGFDVSLFSTMTADMHVERWISATSADLAEVIKELGVDGGNPNN